MTPPSPIPDFLHAFATRRHEALAPFLDEDVVYRVEGFEPILGRRQVLAYWRRMFEVHEVIRMSLARIVRDGDVVIAAQRQFYLAGGREPLVRDSLVVYELEQERVRGWSDALQAADLAEADAALWRRLRTARW